MPPTENLTERPLRLVLKMDEYANNHVLTGAVAIGEFWALVAEDNGNDSYQKVVAFRGLPPISRLLWDRYRVILVDTRVRDLKINEAQLTPDATAVVLELKISYQVTNYEAVALEYFDPPGALAEITRIAVSQVSHSMSGPHIAHMVSKIITEMGTAAGLTIHDVHVDSINRNSQDKLEDTLSQREMVRGPFDLGLQGLEGELAKLPIEGLLNIERIRMLRKKDKDLEELITKGIDERDRPESLDEDTKKLLTLLNEEPSLKEALLKAADKNNTKKSKRKPRKRSE